MTWPGANARDVRAEAVTGTRINYITNPDSRQRKQNLPAYVGVRFERLHPGIVRVFHGLGGALEYVFVVAPGASPRSRSPSRVVR